MKRSPNKGTGAGGTTTTKNGNAFEDKVGMGSFLLANGFKEKTVRTHTSKSYPYLVKGNLYFCTKKALKHVLALIDPKLDVDRFFREPDEAFIRVEGDKTHLYIIEKKNQSVGGSVDIKLLAGPSIIQEYTYMLGGSDRYVVHYRFVLSDWFFEHVSSDTHKNKCLRQILSASNIELAHHTPEYFSKTYEWVTGIN